MRFHIDHPDKYLRPYHVCASDKKRGAGPKRNVAKTMRYVLRKESGRLNLGATRSR